MIRVHTHSEFTHASLSESGRGQFKNSHSGVGYLCSTSMASRTSSRLLKVQQQATRLQASSSRPRSHYIRSCPESQAGAARQYNSRYGLRRKYSTEPSSQSNSGASFNDAANAVVHGSRPLGPGTSTIQRQGTFIIYTGSTESLQRLKSLFLAHPTPRSRYKELVASGALRPDEYQEQIIDILQSLHDKLINYEQISIAEPKQTSSSSLVS